MKHLKIMALVTILAFVSADSFGAGWFQEWRSDRQQRQMKRAKQSQDHGRQWNKHGKKHMQPGPGNPTGAPIDGGLLILLGAAGATYYGVKKKKKNLEG